ncbi:multifunctional CCA addition/repair protein [Bermanella sp. R86510]|uniref:multifunctional CCA addition/repair protein n=1 Tax=unclassified Bermanella TaxID=2627862 RepID=UPI0037C643D4
MKTYLVGGAVRDQLLGIAIKDRDWVVVGATPEIMLDKGYKQVGADFPVFLHPTSQEEYALARTERKSGSGYQGFTVDFTQDVTLEDDLVRRDLTINAMAQDENGTIIDPFNGQQDLENKTLRHVSPAFAEDPLRVLRVARFAARFHHLGFSVANETLQLMTQLSHSGELDNLTPERIWVETQRALSEKSPWIYFKVLRDCQALKACFKEVDDLFGVPQTPIHHPEIDTGIHTLMVLEQASALSNDTEVRFAALVHDLGKAKTPKDNWPKHHAHENLGLKPIKQLCERLKVPNKHRELGLKVCEFHTHVHRAFELKATTIFKLFKQTDALRKPERFMQILLACKADARGRPGFESIPYRQLDYLSYCLEQVQQVDNKAIAASGLSGIEIGKAIEQAQLDAIKHAQQKRDLFQKP